MTTKKQGGARAGSGRKKLGDQPRVTLSLRVDVKTKEKLSVEAEVQRTSIGRIIDQLAEHL